MATNKDSSFSSSDLENPFGKFGTKRFVNAMARFEPKDFFEKQLLCGVLLRNRSPMRAHKKPMLKKQKTFHRNEDRGHMMTSHNTELSMSMPTHTQFDIARSGNKVHDELHDFTSDHEI